MNCTEELKRPRGRLWSTTSLSSLTVKLCGTDRRELWKLRRSEQWHPSFDPLLLFLSIGKHFPLSSLCLTFQPLVHVSFVGRHFCALQLKRCQLWVGVWFWNCWLHSGSFPLCFVILSKCFHFFVTDPNCVIFFFKNFLHSRGYHKYSEITTIKCLWW